MIVRVFFLIFLGGLEAAWTSAGADETVTALDVERSAGFEATEESVEPPVESREIFAPLSPIVVEAESVKLPADQEIE
mgnify:CR=1 FL=1